MILLNDLASRITLDDPEERRILSWVSWEQYEAIQQSEVLPDLDLELLTRCLQNPNPLAAAKAFQQGLRTKG